MSFRFNLINTAPFSLKTKEDQGFHYIPEKEIQKLENDDSDFIFTVMHHPHFWLDYRVKKTVEKEIYNNSDCIFVGHEHYEQSKEISMDSTCVKVFAAGELSNCGDWGNSVYRYAILDTDTRAITSFLCELDGNHYRKSSEGTYSISKNRNNKYGCSPKKEYIKTKITHDVNSITENVMDYYVFPGLEAEMMSPDSDEKDIKSFSELIDMIEKKERLIIAGKSGSGKSLLLKKIFYELSGIKYVLLFTLNDLRGDAEKIVKNKFEEVYSGNQTDYSDFYYADNSDKVFLFDDAFASDVSDTTIKYYLDELQRQCGSLVYTTNDIVEFDIREKIKNSSKNKSIVRYKICSFYYDTREELINRIVKKMVDDKDQDEMTHKINLFLQSQKGLYKRDPYFLVKFIKYYCQTIGENLQNDATVFSKVFEANIVAMIQPFCSSIRLEKVLFILDKISYLVHTTKQYPIDQREITDVIDQYNKDYDSEIKYEDFLNIVSKGQVFLKDGTKYYFSDKNYLAYFTAREIKRRCVEEQDYSEFVKALEYACFGINSDIVMFVTYITDDIRLIQQIMSEIEIFTEGWEEFVVEPSVSIQYLRDIDALKLTAPTPEVIEETREKRIRNEKEEEKVDIALSSEKELYNYSEDVELNLMHMMIRALSLLIIVSKTLPAFEHIMKKETKEKCVELIYTLPLKIFNKWAEEVEKNKGDLLEYIIEMSRDYRSMKMTDDDALKILKWDSISLLLDIMHSSIGISSRDNTYRYIDSFKYKSRALYQIEHLMSLEVRNHAKEFSETAIEIHSEQRTRLIKILTERITSHYLITSKHIDGRIIQRLNAKIWDGRLNEKQILIAKKKNKDDD